MLGSLVEVTRANHEEVERLERSIVNDLQNDPTSNRDRLFQSHRVRNMINHISETTHRLIETYEDKDNAMKDEIASLGDQTPCGTNVFSAFYDRLKQIREYNMRYRVVDATDEYEQEEEEPCIEFSVEEGFGLYLDMHELYNDYINSKFGEPIEYLAYLQVFPHVHQIPRKLKLKTTYTDYLIKLVEYLVSFFVRIEPLQDLERIFSNVKTELDEQWASQGWENDTRDDIGHDPSQRTSAVDLDDYNTVEELIQVGGPERLKVDLAALGLKTGGTIRQRAERLFLTKDTPFEKLDSKHFLKGSRGIAYWKEIALMEANMEKLCDLLQETIVRTKENVERRQTLTYEEMEAEREEEEEVQADTQSDDDNQQTIYNPLKLPMGYDGKPIPYWLYKFHGLRQEFKCEICGNQSYWGRRAFEHHFKELRHQHGMRCLGIPNTKNFNEITSIKEAKELWNLIQEQQEVNKWRPYLEEEYEDQDGNIYNKTTYTDLQRQGLI